jgi:ATP-dependent Clp protease ATP-binding subunit ClpC
VIHGWAQREKSSKTFENLNDQARRSILFAVEAARSLGRPEVGTEHLLLSLLRVRAGTSAEALAHAGVSLPAARQEVEKTGGLFAPEPPERARPQQHLPDGAIPLSPEVKTVIELSSKLARVLGDDRTGTEHLLLILIRDTEVAAAQVLARLGADLDRIRQETIRLHVLATATEPRPDSDPPMTPNST